MDCGAAQLPNGIYLLNVALSHAGARGYEFDDEGKSEFLQTSRRGMRAAYNANIISIDDLAKEVIPHTIRLTESVIAFAEDTVLTLTSVQRGLAQICPLFPFCLGIASEIGESLKGS